MPELQLLGRRWHMATDTLPVMMCILCLAHVCWFIPYATGYYSIEGTGLRYDCPDGAYLRVANYALFALFGLAALNEAAITLLGLRGGPFETRKRRHIGPLLYLEIVIWLLLLAFTLYATIVVWSSLVAPTCWTNNPCQYTNTQFPLACQDKDGKLTTDLTPACKEINDLGFKFINACWNDFTAYAANWVISAIRLWDTYAKNSGLPEGVARNCTLWNSENDTTPEMDDIGDAFTAWFENLYVDPPNDTMLCNATRDSAYFNAALFNPLDSEIDLDDQKGNIVSGWGFDDIQEWNAFLKDHPDFFKYANTAILVLLQDVSCFDLSDGKIVDLNDSNLASANNMPWYPCLSQECKVWTTLADECSQWEQIMAVPDPSSRKRFFEVVVITSWAVLGCTALIFLLCFNAFQSYDDVDSWEGTVKSLAGCFCCGSAVEGSASVGGSDLTVSHEIAKSLNLLFGGIDMDPTDRLLGVYLVSERQHRRRQQDVLSALQDAGYAMERRQSRLSQALQRVTPRSRRKSGSLGSGPLGSAVGSAVGSGSQRPASAAVSGLLGAPPPASGNLSSPGKLSSLSGDADSPEAPMAVPLNLPRPAASASAVGRSASLLLPPSPFETAGSEAAGAAVAEGTSLPGGAEPSGRATAQLPGNGRLLLYQHSMLRLRSSISGFRRGAASPADALDTLEEGQADAAPAAAAGRAAGDPPEPELTLEAARGPQGKLGGSPDSALAASRSGSPELSGGWKGTALRVTSRFRPLLTPSGCAGSRLVPHPPLSPQAAAEIYAGRLEPVSRELLREAQAVSKFAVASYGLQSVIWAKGKRPAMCLANANRLVRCLKSPLRLESKFRKKNFDAILEMTGVAPSDLLYVSYANVAGGVLPYLIMLHRPSKSVVLSVRGTVSMEDLITDLLSNPVDVADWVPEWVREEAARRKAAGVAGDASGDALKAHIGIVSSATAIMKDMEQRGLLRELLLSKLLRAADLAGQPSSSVIADYLASHEAAMPIPTLPKAPGQQLPPSRASGPLGAAPGSAAEAGAGLAEAAQAAAAAAGEEGVDETERPQFKERERGFLQRLNTLRSGEAEVQLPLDRAQTVIRSKLQLEGWKVVVTGHSLGAAVACMLGMQLRERFTDLRCWAFNPPGGLVSWELAQIAQAYCTSIVVGKDVISRLSFNTSKRVVDEMVVSLARCTRPKLRLAADVALGRRKRADATPTTFCSFADIQPEAMELVEGYFRSSHLHMQSADTTEMYPPGKLVFLRPFKGRKKAQTVWDAVWIDAATLISEGILVTPSMMAHHRLFVLDDAFQSIFADEVATQAAAQAEQGEGDVLGEL